MAQKNVATQLIAGRALVIGASMAGLLAARILSDFYAEVCILERDHCPAEAEARKGVPQGRHAHVLLPKGQQIIEELFPGLTAHLMTLGALRGHGRFVIGGARIYPVKSPQKGLYCSRPLLEREVRARVLALPNVDLLEGYRVLNLIADLDTAEGTGEGSARIRGVVAVQRAVSDAHEIMLADLVVDAAGRGSRVVEWLEELGYPKPEVEVVEVGMGYATRQYRRQAHHLNGDLSINVAPTASNKRACGMIAQEGDRWIVTLAGYFGDHPPTDEAGFLAFAQTLPTPDVYKLISTATPLTDAVAYKFPSNQRRHYEKLTRFPAGLLVMGDAICSFTPIYGQGMTAAALEAMELRHVLEAGRNALAERFFRRITPVVDTVWGLAAGNDLRLTEPAPKWSAGKRLLHWYLDKLLVAARTDPVVAGAFLKVGGLLAPPSSVLKPAIVWRVLRAGGQPQEFPEQRALEKQPVKM